MNSSYFPILLDISKSPALVIGGGKVALRKVQNLLDFNSGVTVLSPQFVPELISLSKKGIIKLIQRKYIRSDCKGYSIVFAATGDAEANKIIKEDCEENGILVNVADVPELCSFIMPATIKKDSLTISIASQGRSPFLVRHIKEMIEENLPEYTGIVAALAAGFRQKVNSGSFSEYEKQELFRAFLDTDWQTLAGYDGEQGAERLLNTLITRMLT